METYSLREIIKDTAMTHSEEITGTGLKCKSCGATDHILKPANHTYLYERVKIALGATQER